ncbi:unnamed protein product [Hermetia illucens]|uniref:Uncharacterized protein n=2 Tax=Hermetia illucens TaxID=343691 RepID=A0A7R8YWC5_HERIL|nr:general odorant-binding protein 99a-like isoform X2 [Hermetia illucens]CAD7087199.1 unnamed protein product [Hermetia illucens]
MKCSLICFLLVFAIASGSDWEPKGNEELVSIRDECFKLENVSEESAAKILKNEYPDEPSVHCYVRCTSAKVGTWDDEAGPDIDRTLRQIQKSGNTITREELVRCKPEKQENKCLWAYKGLMCILKSEGIKDDLIK